MPPSLWQLRVKSSCLQSVGELVDILPDSVLGPSSGDAWPPVMSELSFNCWLKAAPVLGALQGLKLGTLRGHWHEGESSYEKGLGLQNLDTLSVISTDTAKLPPHLQLQRLVGIPPLVRHTALEARLPAVA